MSVDAVLRADGVERIESRLHLLTILVDVGNLLVTPLEGDVLCLQQLFYGRDGQQGVDGTAVLLGEASNDAAASAHTRLVH